MSEYVIQGQTLTSIADAIRGKLETEQQYTPESMAAAIERIKGVDAPEESILKISAVGTGLASVSPSAAGKMQGLTLYGRSWQNGTPSVETEVPIEDAGQSGTVDVTVCGMNLLDTDELINNMQYVPNTGALSPLNGRVSTPKISNFGVPIYVYVPAGISIILVQFNSAGELISRTFHNPNTKIILNAECIEFAITIYTYQNDGIVDFDVIKKNMVIGPALVDQYYPYVVPQQLPIPTPDSLHGIQVDSGGNWTDENGQQWVSDVVDLAEAEKTQKVYKWMLENIPKNSTLSDLGLVIRLVCPLPEKGFYVGNYKFGLCNILEWDRNYNADNAGWYYDSNLVLKIPKTALETYDYAGIVKFLTNSVAYILYCLSTPITTTLDAETVAAYKALQSYPGTTNVLAPDCGIEATAYGNAAEYVSQHTAIQDAAQAAKILLGLEDV